jgi:GNAT superfamily N-acetyltransferase
VPRGLWYARHHAPGEPGYVVVGVAGDEFADGTVVHLPPPVRRPTGWVAEVHVPSPGRVPRRVLVADALVPGAPVLWYVLTPAPDSVAEVDLIAFSTTDRAEGDVLDTAAFESLGLAWSNQVGALRWDVATGRIGQAYVAPAVRRRGVGTKLAAAAVSLAYGLGWAALHADGRRTDLGEAWVSGVGARSWIDVADRAQWAPPMTPDAEATGVPARNLLPDPH